LRPDGVLRRPVKRLNPQVLFDPTEEQFDLPAELIELGDHQCRQKKIISQENQVAVIFTIIKTNSPKRLGIIGFRFRAGHGDGLIGRLVFFCVDLIYRKEEGLIMNIFAPGAMWRITLFR
jgi:hypothetical protein